MSWELVAKILILAAAGVFLTMLASITIIEAYFKEKRKR